MDARPVDAAGQRRPAEEVYAYRRIADEITAWISDGTLQAGDRLPSVRRTCAQWSVSVPTVLQAYRLLEARRMVRARPRSGYFVLARPRRVEDEPRRSLPASAPARVTTGELIVRFLESVADGSLVPLGTALPDPALLPTARLARTLGAVARRDSVRSAMVWSPSGAEELRQQIAQRTVATRAPVTPGDVVVTAGCNEAIALGLRALTRPGDTVVVEAPAYYGTLQVIDALGLRALAVPADPREGIDVAALDAALRETEVAAAVVTPTVHNPLGSVMPEARRRELAAVLDAHGVPALEDDTYADLHFGPERPPSLRAFTRVAPVLVCGSFSKTLASAYRVGWIIPGRYHADVLRLKAATTVATPTPTQLAIAEFLRTGGYDHHVRRLKAALQANVERVTAQVAGRFPPGTRISAPAGGFLLWVELPEAVDALELYARCLGRGVSLAPGPVFSATGGNRNLIRLNGGLLWSPRVEQALNVIAHEAQALVRTTG
ncbi:PLP-dependent aminotransferase family protein [Longimicrobium sp.]|uniref:aminotransferase-like domain-containing protein n=1 Tax=Longimicrobium sp. TaxID=2029185 RepID=UPI003B3B20DA